ncbi:MAG: hypothetical protein NWF00_11725 [Candidatus Bathyarchaeota archaeon]|nr:hypothetical protein [Candidatus Bathyarchaeota archaeon]
MANRLIFLSEDALDRSPKLTQDYPTSTIKTLKKATAEYEKFKGQSEL